MVAQILVLRVHHVQLFVHFSGPGFEPGQRKGLADRPYLPRGAENSSPALIIQNADGLRPVLFYFQVAFGFRLTDGFSEITKERIKDVDDRMNLKAQESVRMTDEGKELA